MVENLEIILASKSPRRKELLSLIGIKYKIQETNFDESSITFKDNDIIDYVIKIAKGKCLNASNVYKDRIILGADTIVYKNNQIFGKPKDLDEAFEYLEKLSNDYHEVITGFCILNPQKKIQITDYDITKVYVQKLSKEEINWYINSDEVTDAAGAYRIQKGFSRYITKIEGSYYNVVGLPINKVYNRLKSLI